MNDFTKEELQDLLKCIKLTGSEFGNCQRLDLLKRKLQSLIDNYCEHDMYETSALVNYCPCCDKTEFVCL